MGQDHAAFPRRAGSSTWTRFHHLAVPGQLVGRGEAEAEVLGQAIGKYRLDVAVSEALISR